jgi:ABC-2 type transport system permease protein
MSGRIVWAIAQKDILDAIKNRYLLMGLILPVGLSLLFRVLFQSISNPSSLTVAVYDPSGSRLTAELLALPGVKVLKVDSEAQLREQVNKGGAATGGISIPESFDQEVNSGRQPELTVYLNPQKGNVQLAAFRELLSEQVWALNSAAAPARIHWLEFSPAEGSSVQSTLRLDLYLLVMFLVMSLTMTGAFVVPLLLVEEKDKHTLEFLLVSPATPTEVVIGKALTGLVYSALGAGTLIALNHGWSGNWPLTVLALILGALFLVAVGLLMGSVFHTMMQVNTWSSIVMLVLLAPSWFTVFQLSSILGTAVRLIPTYYLADLLSLSLNNAATLPGAGTDIAVLLGSLILTFGAVIWILRRQEL